MKNNLNEKKIVTGLNHQSGDASASYSIIEFQPNIEIKLNNVDDWIKTKKKKGIKKIYWKKSGWECLVKFVEAATTPLTYYGMPNGLPGYKIKEGDSFMGIKHYKK